MPKYSVEVASSDACILGEGPHWDPKSQSLYYVDIFGGDVCILDPTTRNSQKNHVGNVSVVIPYDNDPQTVVISQENKLFKFNLVNNEKTLLAEVETDQVGNRFNDGKCDARGRLWIGTMGWETEPGVVPPDRGSLYCFESNHIRRKVENISLSNGIAWSLDNSKMYFIDSTKRLIYVFDYDLHTGNISNQSIFVNYNSNDDFAEQELPDGMTIDKNGDLWVACFNGGRVVKLDRITGKLIDEVIIGTPQITSLCFGGNRLNELYVTSANVQLEGKQFVQQSEQAKAGRLFRVTSDDPQFGAANHHYNFNAESNYYRPKLATM